MTHQGELVGGRYRLVSRVGRGSMGVVWRAHDERLDRVVAVKQLVVAETADERETDEAARRVMREARVAARLRHPHAITVHDVVSHRGRPYLVMEFVSAESLSALVGRSGGLVPGEVATLGAQVAAALAAAHAEGVVHRDVTPGNVLITPDGTAKLADFGISRAAGEATLTAGGFVVGTPAYLAPEVAGGAEAGFPSDVFSLGATLYFAVEGAPPFGTDPNPIALLHRIARDSIIPPQRPGALTDVLLCLLRRDPTERPTMPAVAEALAAVADGYPIPDPTPRASPLLRRASSRFQHASSRFRRASPLSRRVSPGFESPSSRFGPASSGSGRPSSGLGPASSRLGRPSSGFGHVSSGFESPSSRLAPASSPLASTTDDAVSLAEGGSTGEPSEGEASVPVVSGEELSAPVVSGEEASASLASAEEMPGEEMSGEGASGTRVLPPRDTRVLAPGGTSVLPPPRTRSFLQRLASRRLAVAGVAVALVAGGALLGMALSGGGQPDGVASGPPASMPAVPPPNLSSSGPPSPSTGTPPPASCHAEYQVTNSWPGGYQVEVTVRNDSAVSLTGWSVSWPLPAGTTVNNVWNGMFSQAGSTITVTNADFNAVLHGHSFTSFGLIATVRDTAAPAQITPTCQKP